MAYLSQHRQNVLQEAAIAKQALTKGMIVRMRYKKLDGKSKEYWVLILQPRWRGPTDKNYLIHALNLVAFRWREIQAFEVKYCLFVE